MTYSQAILESIFAIWALHQLRFRTAHRRIAAVRRGAAGPAHAGREWCGCWRRALGEARLAICGVLLYVAGLVTLGWAGGLAATVVGLVLCGIGLGAYNPSAFSLASKQSQGHDRGAVMGVYVASASLARIIGPFTSGLIYAALGPSAPFLIGACVTLPAAWLVRRAGTARA